MLALVDAAGAVTDRYVYTPYGVEEPLSASANPFRYTGRRYDPETGLYHYRARYYDADLGRFLSTDPIGYADQWNLYAYVHNDPLNLTDPSGMEGEDDDGILSRILPIRIRLFDSDNIASQMQPLGRPETGEFQGPPTPSLTGDAAADTRLAAGVAAATEGAVNGLVNAPLVLAAPGAGRVVQGGSRAATNLLRVEPNRINSARVLLRSAEDAGPMHNFPVIVERTALQGERTVISENYTLYRTGGSVNGRPGVFEIGVRPSTTGRTEVITHRFFRPDPQP